MVSTRKRDRQDIRGLVKRLGEAERFISWCDLTQQYTDAIRPSPKSDRYGKRIQDIVDAYMWRKTPTLIRYERGFRRYVLWRFGRRLGVIARWLQAP